MKVLLFLTIFFSSVLVYASCIESSEDLTIDDLKKSLICFQKEIDNLKKSKGKIVVNTHKDLPKALVAKSTSLGSLQIDLNQCKRNNTRVTCDLVLTNQDKDFLTYLYAKQHSEAYDEYGYQHPASIAKLLDKSSKRVVKHKLIKGVPVKASLVFNDISANVTQFTLLDILLYVSSNSGKHVQFRNIAITK